MRFFTLIEWVVLTILCLTANFAAPVGAGTYFVDGMTGDRGSATAMGMTVENTLPPLSAVARDRAGNIAPAQPVIVTVDNAPADPLTLWVDRNSLEGPCSNARTRNEVSASTPWCTLGVAGDQVLPGDTVYVREGEYSELQTCGSCNDNSVFQVVVSGEADAPIRFEAAPGETVRITGTGGAANGVQIIETYDGIVPRFIEIKGFTVTDFNANCIKVNNTSDLVLEDLDISQCRSGAVELHRSARVSLLHSRIHDNPLGGWTSAVDLYLCRDGNIVRGNSIWNNTDTDSRESEGHGITMDYCQEAGGALIENNLIYDNEGWCMAIYFSDGSVIRNNTCWTNGNGRESTGEISLLGRNHAIYNNILVPRDGRLALNIRERDPYIGHFDTIASDYNILWAPTHMTVVGWAGITGTVAEYQMLNSEGWGVNTLQVDPVVISAATGDFRLQAVSPAIDSGDPNNAAVLDILKTARPQDGDSDGLIIVDRGAYEYNAPADSFPWPMFMPAITVNGQR